MRLKTASPSREALSAALDWLLVRQSTEGWWTAELETNVTMTAEHVLLLRFLGLPLDAIREGAIRHILNQQREDGSWALYFDGPADLSTTIEAYVALKVLGLDPSKESMRRARRVVREQGGLTEARVFTKIWMALFGQYPWIGIPSMPPEMIQLPPALPFNLYDFACWARGTIAGLLIVLAHRPVRDLGCTTLELIVPGTESQMNRSPGSGVFWWADRLLKLYDRLPAHPGRALSRARVVQWIVERQEADGSWGGIQPPWVYSLIGLNLEGMGIDHPVMRRGLAGLEGFSLKDDGGWRLQACMSPVWDTAWALLALKRSRSESLQPQIRAAADWLLAEQIRAPGDWQIRAPHVECGGWAFEFENDIYPDIDDTAVVAVALLESAPGLDTQHAVHRALKWILAMRSRNGAWAAFDRDNTSEIVYKLPFADFGAMLDPPSEDVTAHVLEMLAALGYTVRDRVVVEALRYLQSTQRPDGSFWGRWGVNHVYGTWCVIAALTSFKERTGSVQAMVDRAVDWLLRRQNEDGGWGETCYSYEDVSFAGAGVSTPSQTAWAVIALQSAGLGNSQAALRGVNFLCRRQVDGTWDEPQYTGTGFPRDFYINYHLYRHLFPTLALAGRAETG
ncbi:MAG TPA: squalene--hopene cyclase [Chloroflexota bacterium]|nr:squalene--hopene cyclase [Chloroflexota bacterium]